MVKTEETTQKCNISTEEIIKEFEKTLGRELTPMETVCIKGGIIEGFEQGLAYALNRIE